MHEPKFKPGDFVVNVAQMEAIRLGGKDGWILQKLTLFQVLEVIMQTCYGGTQILYSCRATNTGGIDREPFRFVEIELIHAPSEPLERPKSPPAPGSPPGPRG